jgi:crotonobetainyl-CoA:carnitine CoA-transferase CaiB-like acyl-CoA transferase
VACYNLYRTQDGRWLAVAALELKFWETLCHALDRPEWAFRHWSVGQAIAGPDALALIKDVADLIASRPLEDWTRLLEPLDCCVSPVLTAAEAAQHPLFNPDAEVSVGEEPDEADGLRG